MNKPNLDARLLAVSKYVRRGAYVCDVGTDHAYLPVYLVLTGRVAHALASDINEGPVMRARQSVARYHVSDKIEVMLADGLRGADKYPVTDIVIAGMGGELIASIINAAEWTRDKKYRLILQPMTHAEILRGYLVEKGYSIIDEEIVTEQNDSKIYQIICAEFTGISDKYVADELLLGRINISQRKENLSKLCKRLKSINLEIKKAKASAGQSTEAEDEIISIADKYIKP
jgi:tRNA (adenine22-N1)-methyltransferase